MFKTKASLASSSAASAMQSTGHREEPAKGILLMTLASFSFSCMGVCSKSLSPFMPAMEIAFFRTLATALLILPFMFVWKVPLLGQRRHLLYLRSVLGFISLNFTFYSIAYIKLAEASVLFNTSVLFVPLLSAIMLKERVAPILLAFIITGFVGAVCVLKPSGNLVNMPGLAALGAGMFSAVVFVAIRELHNSNSFLTIIFNFSAISAALSLIFFGRYFVMPPQESLLLLLGVGVSGTFGQLFMTYSYKLAPAAVVSPFTFLGVAFGIFWDLMLWGAYPELSSLLGIVLIVGSGIGILRLRRAVST